MTDLTAGTDFCFTNSNVPSPQRTVCCFVLACLVHILSWSHSKQTPAAPINAGRSLLPSAALVILCQLKVVLPSSCGAEGQSHSSHHCRAHAGQEGRGSRDEDPVPLGSGLPGFHAQRLRGLQNSLPLLIASLNGRYSTLDHLY